MKLLKLQEFQALQFMWKGQCLCNKQYRYFQLFKYSSISLIQNAWVQKGFGFSNTYTLDLYNA